MIILKNINKFYNKGKQNELHVVKNISLELPDFGFVALLGKSGCGKTTLLNIIGGLDKASGNITYDGNHDFSKYNMNLVDSYRNQNIGYIFQDFLLLNNETIYNNIDNALKIYGISNHDERKKRINASLKCVDMLQYRRKRASALSGGQKQRVAIARALAKLPKIIIADEPTGNLDSDNSNQIMSILQTISKDRLVLMVSHNEKLVANYCDRIIRYKDGTIYSDDKNIVTNKLKLNEEYDGNNAIDLTQLKKEELNIQNIHLNTYGDNDKNIDITIINKDNKTYLYVDDKNVILNDSSIRLIDDIKEKVDKNEEDNIPLFDHSDFVNEEIKSISTWTLLKNKLKKKKGKTKLKTKLYNFLLLVVGLNVGIFSLFSYTTFENKSFVDAKNYYDSDIVLIDKDNYYGSSYNRFITSLVEDMDTTHITGIQKTISIDSSSLGVSTFLTSPLEVYCGISYPEIIDSAPSIYCGDLATDKHEVNISKGTIDFLFPNFSSSGYDYDIFIGNKLTNFSSPLILNGRDVTPTIVGIIDSNKLNIYFGPKSYDSLYESLFYSSVNIARRRLATYYDFKILNGEPHTDVNTPMPSSINVYGSPEILSMCTHQSFYEVYQDAYYFNFLGEVNGDVDTIYFATDTDFDRFCSFVIEDSRYLFNFTPSDIILKDGRLPSKYDEILVPSTYDKNNINTSLNIVGTYESSSYNYLPIYYDYSYFIYTTLNNNNRLYENNNNLLLEDLFYEYSPLCSNDVNASISYMNSVCEDSSMSLYDGLVMVNNAMLLSGSITTLIVIFIFLIVLFVLIGLSTRSSMMKKIYDISVLRSLGCNKKFIYKLFLIDNLIHICKTAILGSLISMISYYIFYCINPLLIVYIPIYIPIIVILLLATFTILATLLPLSLLLRKTPFEIATKYDI